jgi:DNA-binding transcriptional ArsR family regulator
VIEFVKVPQHLAYTAPVFAALGDPCRLSIIERLCENGPLATAMLNDGEKNVSRQGLTKHLRVLEGVGLIDSFRVGRDRHWQMRSEQLAAVSAYLDEVKMEWEARLKRLKSLVEEGGSKPAPYK